MFYLLMKACFVKYFTKNYPLQTSPDCSGYAMLQRRFWSPGNSIWAESGTGVFLVVDRFASKKSVVVFVNFLNVFAFFLLILCIIIIIMIILLKIIIIIYRFKQIYSDEIQPIHYLFCWFENGCWVLFKSKITSWSCRLNNLDVFLCINSSMAGCFA